MSELPNRISRRAVLSAGVSVGAAATFGAVSRSLAADAPVAKTVYGRVRGATTEGVHVFKGVPYGASTSGTNRFKPPVSPTPWSDVRDAVTYGPSTLQTNPQVRPAASASAEFIGELSDRPESEDC